jgi:hypothetical protein
MATLQVKRGTRAQLDSAAGSSALRVGEPYLITDENRLAVGLTTSTYVAAAKSSETVTVSATAPTSPTLYQLWLDIT